VKDDRLYLLHIKEAIEWIEEFTIAGENEFFGDRKTQDAVLRNLHTLSESTQHLSNELKNNILRLTGEQLLPSAMSLFMTIWASILIKFGILLKTTCQL
jgi:uncharacterized protein with HEPN domain